MVIAENDGKVRILLADGQALFREAVRAALQGQPDIEVVAEASDCEEALAEAEKWRPDVAVLDAHLPDDLATEAIQAIRERVPGCAVMVLANDEDQRSLLKSIEAGASGFLTRDRRLTELVDAARAIHRGETLIPSTMLGDLLSQLVRRGREEDEALKLMAGLTRREREVLRLLARGADNDAIAEILVISPQTARTHIQNILGKLNLHSRLEAAAFVVKHGVHDKMASAGPNKQLTAAD